MTINEANFKPSGHNILVCMDEVESETQGGIYIPQDITDKEEMAGTQATIIAIGAAAWADSRVGPWAKVGDHVMIAKFAGQLWKVKGSKKKYRVIADLSVVGIIHDVTI